MQRWEPSTSPVIYRRFQANENLVAELEKFALSEGIREAAITSCIGSLQATEAPQPVRVRRRQLA